jgi:hypothetical protein
MNCNQRHSRNFSPEECTMTVAFSEEGRTFWCDAINHFNSHKSVPRNWNQQKTNREGAKTNDNG